MDALEFFRQWYGESEGWLQLWRSDTKSTKWIKYPIVDKTTVVKYVEASWEKPFDAYYGLCLQDTPAGPRSRGKASNVTVSPGVWVDIDFADKDQGEVKKKKRYPTADQALQAVKMLGVDPTLTINSGGGLHLYWMFDEPFRVTSDEKWQHIANIVEGWQRRLRMILMKRFGGVALDSTHDLCRIFRIPGSTNTRVMNPGGTHTVSVVGEIGNRYSIAKFELVSGESKAFSPAKSPAGGRQQGHTTRKGSSASNESGRASRPLESKYGAPAFPPELATPNAEPPSAKLFNFCEYDPKFKRCWLNRVDKYPSSSEYHIALANYAIGAGWTPEETAALIVAFTREHYPENIEKVLRINNGIQDYLHLTISKAHDIGRSDNANQASQEAATELVRAAQVYQETGDVDRQEILDHVTNMLGIQVVGFHKTGSGRAFVYSIEVIPKNRKNPVECIIGPATLVRKADAFLDALMDGVDHVFAITKKIRAEWASVVQGLIAIVERHEVAEVSFTERTQALVEELIRVGGVDSVETPTQRGEALLHQRPFIEKGSLFINGTRFRQLVLERDSELKSAAFRELRKLGFEPKALSYRGTSRSTWKLENTSRFLGLIQITQGSILTSGDNVENNEKPSS